MERPLISTTVPGTTKFQPGRANNGNPKRRDQRQESVAKEPWEPIGQTGEEGGMEHYKLLANSRLGDPTGVLPADHGLARFFQFIMTSGTHLHAPRRAGVSERMLFARRRPLFRFGLQQFLLP